MNDDEFESLLRTTGPRYWGHRQPDLDRLWLGIERRAFPPRRRWQGAALAATLVIGVGLGWFGSRLTMPSGRGTVVAPPAGPVAEAQVGPSPFVGVARDYFRQTTALLVALAGDLRDGKVQTGTVSQARDLLSTTRLLLDADPPEPGVRGLLEDLELVLAQVVRLPEARGAATDTELIVEAMDRREVLSRLTSLIVNPETAP